MANSKHAHLRYNILDYCFRYKALISAQLLEYVNDKIIELEYSFFVISFSSG